MASAARSFTCYLMCFTESNRDSLTHKNVYHHVHTCIQRLLLCVFALCPFSNGGPLVQMFSRVDTLSERPLHMNGDRCRWMCPPSSSLINKKSLSREMLYSLRSHFNKKAAGYYCVQVLLPNIRWHCSRQRSPQPRRHRRKSSLPEQSNWSLSCRCI